MWTIRDVAERAGVSYTTVSHVLNNTRPVSEEKRARVLAAIAEMNYVPSAPARSLKAKTTATIGLVVPNNTNPYFAEFARGIEGSLRRRGYCVILCNSDNDILTQRECLRVLHQNRIDGLIVASVGEDESVADDLRAVRVPVVIVDRPIAGLDADFVQIDHEAGAMMATRHLLDLGHTRVGCIAGASDTAVSATRFNFRSMTPPDDAACSLTACRFLGTVWGHTDKYGRVPASIRPPRPRPRRAAPCPGSCRRLSRRS